MVCSDLEQRLIIPKETETQNAYYFLLFGRSPRHPIDVIFGTRPTAFSSYSAYVKEWQEAMKKAYGIATKNSRLSGVV